MSIISTIISKILQGPASSKQASNIMAGEAAANPSRSAAVETAQFDVSAMLNGLASENAEKLNWQTSIVDLMKLLSLDSSLGSRKQLATELGFKDNADDTASMNMWLISEVMKKLAANGGKVPSELMH